MPIQGCTSGWAVTAVVTTLLLLPAQYYVPKYRISPDPGGTLARPDDAADFASALQLDLPDVPRVDLYLAVCFVFVVLLIYLSDWVQRKLMEKRIIKLNQYLMDRIEKLRVWDARQEKQQVALRLVQNATSEYNVLLYLLLRQHKMVTDWKVFDKDLEDFDTGPNEMQDFF